MPVLAVSYPLLVHLAILWQQPLLQWLSLVVLCAIPQYAGLRAGRPRNWLLLLTLAMLLYGLTRIGAGLYALYLPPIVLPAMVLAVFYGSLRANQVPLVTRMARAIRDDDLPPDFDRYTRQVTVLWVLVLAIQVALAAGLVLFASIEVWSWYTNVLAYFVMGLVFALEYAFRRWRFRHLPHPSIAANLRIVFGTNYRTL